MKTKTLISFQYENAATTYLVHATEYTELAMQDGSVWRLRIIDNGVHTLTAPHSRAECIKAAEIRISEFVQRMHSIYDL